MTARQQSLFYPHSAGFQMTETSHEAAKAARQSAKSIRATILLALKRRAMTPDEVADLLGLSVLAVRPRFTELKKMKAIRDTGLRRVNISGKRAVVFEYSGY